MNKLIKKTDIVIIFSVILIAAAFLIFQKSSDGKHIAEISVDGKVIETVNLDDVTGRVEIIPDTNPKVVIVAENGEIYFESAECPDKICVAGGKLRRRGDTAVCLPAKTVVSITGSSADAITY